MTPHTVQVTPNFKSKTMAPVAPQKVDTGPNLDSMTPTQLDELIAKANERKAKARQVLIGQARDQLLGDLEENGLTLAEVFPELSAPVKTRRSRTVHAAVAREPKLVAAKYRDPATGKTWAGRGRQPKWMSDDKADWKRFEI